MRARVLRVVLLLVIIFSLTPARGYAQTDDSNIFAALFPELNQMAAPSWLKEGTRITYSTQNTVLGGDADDPHPGGPGYVQHDLVALERRKAVWLTTILLISGAGNAFPSLSEGWTGLPSSAEFYLNPDVLDRAEDVASDDLSVTRMPYEINGATWDAVRFESASDKGEYVWMFDQKTGILLFHRYAVQGNNGVSAGDMTLANVRRLRMPWRARAVPDWVQKGLSLDYEGGLVAQIAGVPSVPLPASLNLVVTQTRPTWAKYTVSTSSGGMPVGATTQVEGLAQLFGGPWLPAEALSARPRNAVLDTDPVTGLTVRFARGDGTIRLTQSGADYSSTMTYDGESGMLTALHSETPIGIGANVVDFALQE